MLPTLQSKTKLDDPLTLPLNTTLIGLSPPLHTTIGALPTLPSDTTLGLQRFIVLDTGIINVSYSIWFYLYIICKICNFNSVIHFYEI